VIYLAPDAPPSGSADAGSQATPAQPFSKPSGSDKYKSQAVDNFPQPYRAGIFKSTVEFIRKTLVIAELEIYKLRRDPSELIMRAVQPVLWLVVFGSVFTRIRAIPTGDLRYIDFLAPGVLAQSVLFVAIFYGISIIMDRELGIMHKFLVSPTPRTALVLGKALSAGVRAIAQAVIIYAICLIVGVKMNYHPLAIAGVLLVVVLGATLFSTFSLIIACIVRTRERFMGIGQIMTMPLFFASNAIYPIAIMPTWLQVISKINPLTYEVDALRALMIANGTSTYGITADLAMLFLMTTLLVIIGGNIYHRIIT